MKRYPTSKRSPIRACSDDLPGLHTAPGSRLLGTLSGGPGPFSGSQTFGASDHRACAGLKPRIGPPPCSPTAFPVVSRGEGLGCGPHNFRARKGNRRLQAAPAKTQQGLRRTQSLTRQRPSESSSPAAQPWCGPGPPGVQDVGLGEPSLGIAVPLGGSGAQPSAALFRVSASKDTARARHASLTVQEGAGRVQARRRGPGAPANEPCEPILGRSGQAPEPGAWGPRRETKAPNGDPGVWPTSHRHSGAADPFSARSEAPRMEDREEMLVDQSERNPPFKAAAPGRFTKTCRSNLQQEQACSGLRSTMVIATSGAGLWSSAPYSPAESQPLGRSPKERNALKAAARGARQPVRVSPGRVAGRRQLRRTPEPARGLCLGGGSPLGTARRGVAERPRRQTRAGGERKAAAERPSPGDCRAAGQPEQGRFCRGLGCVNCELKQRKENRKQRPFNTKAQRGNSSVAGLQRAVRTAEIKKHLRNSSAAEPGAPGDSFHPALSVTPSPGASRSGPLLERGPGARKSEPWAPRPISDVPRAPLLPVLLSGFPQRPEGQGRSRGGERAGMRGPAGGRVRGEGAVSPRGAEPGRSEALSPAEGPLRRRRGHRFLHISGLRGIGTVSGARDSPALSSPPPGFSGRTRLPGSSGGQGPGAPAGTGPQIPPSTGPSVRVACPAGAASRSGRPSGSPSWGDAAAGGAVGRGHGAAWAPDSAGRPVCSPRAGGHQARRLGRLPAERRGGPETTTWGQLHTLSHASRGSQTLRGMAWVPVLSSDLGEEAVGSGETLDVE
ncbi:collagen alpha-1(I) chain-like [Bos indicus]|uniref:Collagen alpha-1(I) chain-like n=1 Tax=Bos indicus TaxID=9915 RepID=A0ABM4T7C4_BOSIN